jgi:hypothetical protein
MDCTFCRDCVHACPHDNVGILPRLPARELFSDPWRLGSGRFSRRRDLAALVVVFTFGALLNAFGMVSPVYRVEAWLAQRVARLTASVLQLVTRYAYVLEPFGFGVWVAHYAFHFLGELFRVSGGCKRPLIHQATGHPFYRLAAKRSTSVTRGATAMGISR